MVFLTLGDRYSGVIASQVLDVAAFLQKTWGKKVLVIAFISIRQFFPQRKKFKSRHPHVWVLPMMPGLHRWRLNRWMAALVIKLSGQKQAVCRNVLATNLALDLQESGVLERVVYDGRGAIQAEWHEYEVVDHPGLKVEIFDLEKRAVLESNWRIGVSEALVRYWNSAFGYADNKHSVIPCTVNPPFLAPIPSPAERSEIRAKYGFKPEEVVLIYAGSSAGWQSFDQVDGWLTSLMEQQAEVKILFLAKIDLSQLTCYRAFPDRVKKDWLAHQEVPDVLAMGDYGILIREKSVTNQVASPTKFAEYVSRGLKVLISPEIGDYSELVAKEVLGEVIDITDVNIPELTPTSEAVKESLHERAKQWFTKNSFKDEYGLVLGEGESMIPIKS